MYATFVNVAYKKLNMRNYIFIIFVFYFTISYAQFQATSGFFSKNPTTNIAIVGDTIYASGNDKCIYMSVDAGLTWNNKIEINSGLVTYIEEVKGIVYVVCKALPKTHGEFSLIYKIENGIISVLINQHEPSFLEVYDILILGDSILLATDKGLFLNNTTNRIKLPVFDKYNNKCKYKWPKVSFIKSYNNRFLMSMSSCLLLTDSTFINFKFLANTKSFNFDPIYSDGTFQINEAFCFEDSVLFASERGIHTFDFKTSTMKTQTNIVGFANCKYLNIISDIIFSNSNTLYTLKHTINDINEGLPKKIVIYDLVYLKNRIILSTDRGFYYREINKL